MGLEGRHITSPVILRSKQYEQPEISRVLYRVQTVDTAESTE
jgi:hypothetical protein